jgi:hypothetical protein
VVTAPIIVLLLSSPVWVSWLGAFANGPAEEILRTKRHQFLGPGGSDDSFASDPWAD